MRVLVINAGSSNLKWAVLEAGDRTTVAAGTETWTAADPARRGEQLRAALARTGPFDVIGHRIVHGGTRFTESVVIGRDTRAALASFAELDPLHMVPALAAIDALAAAAPSVVQIAAFDTAFHAHMPEAAARYALPFEWTERWGIRRFGFHGLSVRYSVERAGELLGAVPRRMIVCHLGSGCSVTAVANGVSVDTTMGFTPLEGMMMATRAGSIDPGLLLDLQRRCGVGVDELADALETRSGLLGVSGVSSDLREVLAAADAGSPRAKLAYELFVHTLRRAAGAMLVVLGGLDVVVFTGGIGEHSARVRDGLCASLTFAGALRVLVIPAREDLVILDEVLRLHPVS